jgi:hypothetical protein
VSHLLPSSCYLRILLNTPPRYRPVLVTLLDVVLAIVGGLAWELIALLIGNGCAGLILGLRLDGLISALGLGGLGGLLGLGHGR